MRPIQLSKADSKVLAQVFDPESGPTRVEVLVDPSLQPDRHVADTGLLTRLKAREKEAIRMIEVFETCKDRTQTAKVRAYEEASAILKGIISECPSYASARNNRAQLVRWRFGDRNLLCRSRSSEEREATASATMALEDLSNAISLASPARIQDAVSPTQGKLLAQAYTQLGAIYFAASKDLELAEDDSVIVHEACEGWAKDRFEEEASRMFFLGGSYGNEVAKALAVHTNPHAKLCGSIVKEAMRKELAQA